MIRSPRSSTLLAHPNVASNEDIIRRYDHEILGSTVVRPLVGVAADAPADGVVIAGHAATEGFAVGIGVNPWYGLHDPEAMAIAVVDEAIRNVVAVGADPDRVALLDNFSWGDPRRESTLGDLVAAVDGCCRAAAIYGAPFVSGKDSLNNEYVGHDGQRHAVPPTLVITAVAHVPDADRCVTPDLHDVGNVLFQVGTTRDEFAGSHLDMVNGQPDRPGRAPAPDPDAPARYRRLHAAIRAGIVRACHDISEGGLAVALAEMCIGGRLGATIDDAPPPRRGDRVVQRIDRPVRRRGRTRRRRAVRRDARAATPPGSAWSRTTGCSASVPTDRSAPSRSRRSSTPTPGAAVQPERCR